MDVVGRVTAERKPLRTAASVEVLFLFGSTSSVAITISLETTSMKRSRTARTFSSLFSRLGFFERRRNLAVTGSSTRRTLRLESCEDRRMLATITGLEHDVLGDADRVTTVEVGDSYFGGDLSGSVVEVASKLYDVDQQLNLQKPAAGYYENYRGLNEKYLIGNNKWYYILPTGELYRWGGSIANSLRLTTLSTEAWRDPSTLHEAKAPSTAASLNYDASTGRLTITSPDGYTGSFQAALRGVVDGQTESHYFTVSIANQAPVLSAIGDVSMSGADDTTTIELDYTDPDGDALTVSAEVVSQMYALDQQLGLKLDRGTDYFNYRGLNEKYFRADDNIWYYILPNGSLYQWGGSIAASQQVATLPKEVWSNSAQLHNALAPEVAEQAYTLDQSLGLGVYHGDNYFSNYRGHGEKYFYAKDTGQWYFILQNGDLYRWKGSIAASQKIATLSTEVWASPELLDRAIDPDTPAVDLSIDPGTGQLTIDPPDGYLGTFTVLARATDGTDTAAQAFAVTVDDSVAQADASVAEALVVAQQLGPATLSGVKYEDLTGDGLTGDDTPLGGITVELYLDDGDDTFDPNTDTLVDTQVSADGTGAFSFTGLADGLYFMQEDPPANATQTGGPAFYTIEIVDGHVYSDQTLVIDDFSSTQQEWVIAAADPDPTHLEASGSMVGGERDLLIDVLGQPQLISSNGSVGDDGGDTVLLFASAQPGALVTLQYDGADTDTAGPPAALVNSEGLSTDLSGSAALRFEFDFLQIGGGVNDIDVVVNMTSTGGGTATFTDQIAENLTAFDYYIPLSSFTTAGGFSLADVTSIEITLNGGGVDAVDYQLDNIVAVAGNRSFDFANTFERPDVSGVKYEDLTGDGLTGDDTPLGGVTVELYLDDGDGVFDPNADALVDTQVSADNTGTFTFSSLDDGLYFMREVLPINATQSGGPSFYTIAVVEGQVYSDQTLVIDDFSSTQQQWVIAAADPDPTHLEASGSMVGGERDLLVDVLGQPQLISSNGSVGDDGGDTVLLFASAQPGALVTLQYDGADTDTAGPPAALVNSEGLSTDLSGSAALRFEFDFLQIGGGVNDIDVVVNMTSTGGGTATFTDQIAENLTAFDYYIPLSSFTTAGGFSLADVTSIEITLNGGGVDAVDYQLDNIVAVAGNRSFDFANTFERPDVGGIKYNDITGDGITGDDTRREGVTFELYLDDGDGTFDPNTDALVDTDTTDVNGEYTFDDLDDGRYFIREAQPSGALQTAGPAYYTIDVVEGQVLASQALVVDDFSSTQQEWVIAAANPDPTHLEASGSMLGGERDLLVDVLGQPQLISSNGSVGDDGGDTVLLFASSAPGTLVTLQYDGADADTAGPPAALVNSEGLSADLTANGGAGFRFDFDFLQIGGGVDEIEAEIRLTSAGGGTATYNGSISENLGEFDYLVPYAAFTTAGGFTFADVTSIEIDLNTTGVEAVDYQLDNITIAQGNQSFDFANKRGSLAGCVYVDINDNGVFDNGESVIANAEIRLTGTDVQGNAVDITTKTDLSGMYIFTDLLEGTYTITETQPAAFVDGKDTIGTPGGVTSNDQFSQINLPAGFDGVDNYFGELHLQPPLISKRVLIYPEINDDVFDADTGQALDPDAVDAALTS